MERKGAKRHKVLELLEEHGGAKEGAATTVAKQSGVPEAVQTLAQQIKDADAVVISAPEYNKGITGVLKNALDWISRVEGAAFRDKPTVVISAAAGRTGGETAQFMTLSCLTQLQARLLPGTSVLIAGAMNAFDDNGKLKDETSRKLLATRMEALRAEVS